MNTTSIIMKVFIFLVVKLSIYLNRCVFVMLHGRPAKTDEHARPRSDQSSQGTL